MYGNNPDAIQVRIRRIDEKAISKKNPIGEILRGRTVGILLSPFAPGITPILLSAILDALQYNGATASILILSNYIYNEKTKQGVDISKSSGDELQKTLVEGETLLKSKLKEVFDSKLNPNVTFNRVIQDHAVELIHGKNLREKELESYKQKYVTSLENIGFKNKHDETVGQFVKKHDKKIDEQIRTNNSAAFLALEGPQYAYLAETLDYILYPATETSLLQACREFVPEKDRAKFIECEKLQTFVANNLKNGRVNNIHQDGGGINKFEYSISTMPAVVNTTQRPVTTPDHAELRTKILTAINRNDFDKAIELVGSINTGNDHHLVTMVDSISSIIIDLLVAREEGLKAKLVRTLNGFGLDRTTDPTTQFFQQPLQNGAPPNVSTHQTETDTPLQKKY